MIPRTLLYFRSFLFFFILCIVTPCWAIICFLSLPFPYQTRYYITARWNVFVIWLAKRLCGIHYQIKGESNLPHAPAILLCKHQSAWETIFLFYQMPRPLAFVLKRELLWVPFFGWALRLLRMIPIDRKNTKSAFKNISTCGQDRLDHGQWIIMFPEGTRIAPGKKGKYKSGGARLALQTQTPIIPIAINAGRCWPKNSLLKYPGMVTVSIGPAISPQNTTSEQLIQQVETWIENEMRVISPNDY
jgi:1-acyl-sn-glycerol-3-phosphate acyltransferase